MRAACCIRFFRIRVPTASGESNDARCWATALPVAGFGILRKPRGKGCDGDHERS